MKVNHVRTLASRFALCATPVAALALGFALQACGGAPDSEPTSSEPVEKTAQNAQDLSILGIPIPQPTLTIGLGDNSIKIDPIGAIDSLVPDAGIKLPDPLAPVNTLLSDLDKGLSVGATVGDISVGIKLPGIELPPVPDPFKGGIPVIGK
ncbi:MAG TPA: hypothetical protein VH044_02860 [Polyangiaceae bacterium]|jgi:hypothetical protein|nr:hypothetical protein [Polyangiaceae bacterium]